MWTATGSKILKNYRKECKGQYMQGMSQHIAGKTKKTFHTCNNATNDKHFTVNKHIIHKVRPSGKCELACLKACSTER